MLCFTAKDFYYNKHTKCFIQEASMFREVMPVKYWNSNISTPIEDKIRIINTITNGSVVFKFTHADFNGSEVCGWNYKYGNLNLLIIND